MDQVQNTRTRVNIYISITNIRTSSAAISLSLTMYLYNNVSYIAIIGDTILYGILPCLSIISALIKPIIFKAAPQIQSTTSIDSMINGLGEFILISPGHFHELTSQTRNILMSGKDIPHHQIKIIRMKHETTSPHCLILFLHCGENI